MAGSGGPWGGGSGPGGEDRNNDGGRKDQRPNGRRPGEGPQIPEIDELVKKGQEQLRVLMGGRGRGGPPSGDSGGGLGGLVSKQALVLGGLAAVAVWVYASAYTVKPEEQAVTLMLGKFSGVTEEGLHLSLIHI